MNKNEVEIIETPIDSEEISIETGENTDNIQKENETT
jgi:hypothetical protein